MGPALDVLNRSLHGDAGARSFLDQTSSIYVLDATDVSSPKTYGCWNFINEAINEVERAEASAQTVTLSAHVQLLIQMALRVARRSSDVDRYLMTMCIENASRYHGSPNESKRLIEINGEIRDIVMGRIAALALDPNSQNPGNTSTFADGTVLDMLCGVLAANAVSNGPAAVHHLISEWILPSAITFPPYCLACVILHLALEASRKTAPAGIQDMLQQVSSAVISRVLAPVLADSIKETNANSQTNGEGEGSTHERNCRIAALCLQAMDVWCKVTDLSLAQIRHVCSKVQINIVDVLSDAMYSDSKLVIDALAELIEGVVNKHQDLTVSNEHMSQVRYIMQVDEASFRSHITKEQLITIESKEMLSILEELNSAIGLQRFRFIDRQNSGDESVCRNLARIGSSIASACIKGSPGNSSAAGSLSMGRGLHTLLIQAASHPSVNVCGLAIDVLQQFLPTESGLDIQLLPILQRRAITPYHVTNGVLSLEASDICSVDYIEFENFRSTVLTEALAACLKHDGKQFLASCTNAVDEFCAASPSVHASFHLEAALFCIATVHGEVAASNLATPIVAASIQTCIHALARKPRTLMANSLTLVQANNLIYNYAPLLVTLQATEALSAATDFALSTFNLCGTSFPDEESSVSMRQEGDVSPYSKACFSLKKILTLVPHNFVAGQAVAAFGAAWELSYSAANRMEILTVDARKAMAEGICYVIACLPENQRGNSLLALAMPSIDCLETMLQHAKSAANSSLEQQERILQRIADEMIIVTTVKSSFSQALANVEQPSTASIRAIELPIIQRLWPSVSQAARQYNSNESVSEALGVFFASCVPRVLNTSTSFEIFQQLCTEASAIVQSGTSKNHNLECVLKLVESFANAHGTVMDRIAASLSQGPHQQHQGANGEQGVEREQEVYRCIESLILSSIDALKPMLGETWTCERQGNGQAAFESKPVAKNSSQEKATTKALPSVFSLLKSLSRSCPIFLLHLPSCQGEDPREDPLFARAINAAVASVLDSEDLLSLGSLEILARLIQLAESEIEAIRNVAGDILSRVRFDVTMSLVIGCCGKLNASTLDHASELLKRLLMLNATPTEELRSVLVRALSNECVHLGVRGKEVVLESLMQSCQNIVSLEDFSRLAHELWSLHQIDTPEALPNSDKVARFCRSYSPS
ncbi:unnamed protein product [Cylindrotheca closterium]|uniref:Uncharacterized protein n=1 Tax=Cylindrotheca closterium TaxID=2856 RepID=A0AAD2FE04_9STRA|nr:unnamed protein product [Cylindrotheca closterium]